jgi:hypothetical protein
MGRESLERLGQQLTSDHAKVMEALASVDGAVRRAVSAAEARTLIDAASLYETDAKRERTTMWRLMAGMFALLAVATGALAFAANRAVPDIGSEHVDGGRFLVFASLSVPPLLCAAYLARLVSVHRRASREIQRQRNQMLTLDPYLDCLPENTRMLYRALLARRFFPRSTDELDAFEDEEFPRPSMILTSVDPGEFASPE